MNKTIKLLSILLLIIVSLSIGTTCFARMTEEEPEKSKVMLDSSKLIAEKEDVARSSILPKEEKNETIDPKLIIAGIVIVIVIVVLVVTLIVIRNKRKMK